MSNQAFSNYEDLLLGSGELFISFSNDSTKNWKHLGNAEEFVISTSFEDIDKRSSMNHKRELQDRNITQMDVTAYAVLNEFDPKNLATALFGEAEYKYQLGRVFTDVSYTATTVPGIVTVIGPDNKRYYGIRDVVVKPSNPLPEGVYWADANKLGEIDSYTNYNDTFIAYAMGGTITIDQNGVAIPNRFDIYVCISKSPDAVGDLYGMEAIIKETNSGSVLYKTFTGSALSETITLASGIKITFAVTGTSTFTAMGLAAESGIKAVALNSSIEYKEGEDYYTDEQSCRAGIIKIPEGSRIRPNDPLSVSCVVPDRKLAIVSGGTKDECECELLFVPDANVGPNYVLEAWKVQVEPEGDMTGLITSGDFGSYRLNFTFLTDYENHPGSPYYTMTLVDYGYMELDNNKYNPEH